MTQTLRSFYDRQSLAVASLASLGAALDARATGMPLEPAIAARIAGVLESFGVGGAVEALSPNEAAALLADVRQAVLSDLALLDRHKHATSWSPNDGELLQAFGEFAKGHAIALTRGVIPALGLVERMGTRGAAFLDIGVGVAGLAIGMAQAWPQLRIVGIDVWQPSLALARSNLDRAGMTDRIELREQSADRLDDVDAFDLVWVPMPFIPERVLAKTWERSVRAMRRDGWIVCAIANLDGADDQAAAVWKLRITTWGGVCIAPAALEEQLRTCGFVDVKTLPGPPGTVVSIVVGRKA